MNTPDPESRPDSTADADPPNHLADLGDTDWRAWRWVALRGAGFPAERILRLAAPDAAARARDLHLAAQRLRSGATSVGETSRDVPGRVLTRLLKALRRFDAGASRLDIPTELGAEAVERLQRLQADVDAARAAFAEAFSAGADQVGLALREAARWHLFREAVLWQNRGASRVAVDSLARKGLGGDWKVRQNEQLVASYLQRYCVKNDTIGFFGPLAWAIVRDDAPAIRLRPGSALVSRRRVYFEPWGIQTLAQKLAEAPGMRPWLPPRLLPYFRVDGGALHVPFGPPIPLSTAQARILGASDGRRTAREIALDLVAEGIDGLSTEQAVYDGLATALETGFITWTLEIAIGPHPELALRRLLASIGDDELRNATSAQLDELVATRDAVARAAGDVDALDAALAVCAATFTRITGAAPSRSAGKTYASRTLLYEDCVRDLDAVIGPGFLRRVAAPLGLLLTSARWLTWQVARGYREALSAMVRDMAGGPGHRVEMTAFQFALMQNESLSGTSGLPVPVRVAQAELQRRWAEILAVVPGERVVRRTAEALRARVAAAFEAPGAGWAAARYVSPDLLIAARDVEAIAAGEFLTVLGELHLGNTLIISAFAELHPAPSQILSALVADNPGRYVVPVIPKELLMQRVGYAFLDADGATDWLYAFTPEPPPPGTDRVLRISSLVIENAADGPIVRTRDGALQFDAIDFLGTFIAIRTGSAFDLIEPASHTPRIIIDDVVVCRERWRFAGSQLPFAHLTESRERFAACAAWSALHGIPRFVFVKTPAEPKPVYADLHSPILVDNVARLVRAGEAKSSGNMVTFTEMVPNLEQLWLTDAAGNRYTSELRVAALDPLAWSR